MLDRLHRIARRIRILKAPLLTLSAICLAMAVYIILNSASHTENRLLIPSILGFLWTLTSATFITSFISLPAKAETTDGWWRRMRRALSRFWHWLIGLLFIATTLALAAFSFRLFMIWLRDYN